MSFMAFARLVYHNNESNITNLYGNLPRVKHLTCTISFDSLSSHIKKVELLAHFADKKVKIKNDKELS